MDHSALEYPILLNKIYQELENHLSKNITKIIPIKEEEI